jgi:hypothetical protein
MRGQKENSDDIVRIKQSTMSSEAITNVIPDADELKSIAQ